MFLTAGSHGQTSPKTEVVLHPEDSARRPHEDEVSTVLGFAPTFAQDMHTDHRLVSEEAVWREAQRQGFRWGYIDRHGVAHGVDHDATFVKGHANDRLVYRTGEPRPPLPTVEASLMGGPPDSVWW